MTERQCDRCGGIRNVRAFTACPECGPVDLCLPCRTRHLAEIASETGSEKE